MTQLKAGNVVGIRTNDGTLIENHDRSPLTWIVEDSNGEIHELQLSIGRMGTYAMFVLPAFKLGQEGDWGEGSYSGPGRPQSEAEIAARVAAAEARSGESIPVAVVPATRRAKQEAEKS